jgi:hypothetical protein
VQQPTPIRRQRRRVPREDLLHPPGQLDPLDIRQQVGDRHDERRVGHDPPATIA